MPSTARGREGEGGASERSISPVVHDADTVMPGLGPGIHEFALWRRQLVDARAKPWHDGLGGPCPTCRPRIRAGAPMNHTAIAIVGDRFMRPDFFVEALERLDGARFSIRTLE